MVPPGSDRVSPAPPYSGYQLVSLIYVYRIFTFYDWTFQIIPLHCTNRILVLQPPNTKYPGLGYSLFARHYSGNLFDFFSSTYLDVSVQWVGFLADDMSSTCRVVSFGNLRFERLFAPNRSLSQLSTSFIASESLGIHRAPLVTFNIKSLIQCLQSNMLQWL